MKRVRITSDGTPEGTRVTDAATGAEIPCIRAIERHIEWADDGDRNILEVANVDLDVGVIARAFAACPECRRIAGAPP